MYGHNPSENVLCIIRMETCRGTEEEFSEPEDALNASDRDRESAKSLTVQK